MHEESTDRSEHPRGRTRDMVVSALFAALLSASAWVVIPLGAVPVTLQVFIVLLAGLVLPARLAATSVAVYLAIGAFGVPVFSGGGAGIGWIAGPTGGYLIGFLCAAPTVALASAGAARRASRAGADSLAVALGVLVVYLIGWTQLALVTGMGWGAAFAAGVAPFIVADAIKGAVVVGVARSLRRAGVLDR